MNESILLMQEILHSMAESLSRAMLVKLDLNKAYNMLQWDFLEEVLLKFCFSNKFVGWIMGCIKGSKFSVLVNRSPTEWFASTKGLRQGDPITPYLFFIAMEVMIRRVKKEANNGVLQGIQLVPQGMRLTQLIYADDLHNDG